MTVVGPAKLNLKGHVVSCDEPKFNGIVFTGKRGMVQNGTVTGCLNGLIVAGEGRHRSCGRGSEKEVEQMKMKKGKNNKTRHKNSQIIIGLVVLSLPTS